jgi:hypothetical protein
MEPSTASGELFRGTHGLPLVPMCPCNIKPGTTRAKCKFAKPPGVPYKYPIIGVVMDDELMAIYS